MNRTRGKFNTYLLYQLLALILTAGVIIFSLGRYLATSHAAAQISRLLTDKLGQAVAISEIRYSDGALQIRGITLANPEGFPQTRLAVVESIKLKADWFSLLSENRTFDFITIQGAKLNLQRNGDGAWNFSQLQRRFSSGKPSSAGLVIRQLKLTGGTVQVNDLAVAGISFDIANLATKGSDKSGFNLLFDDPGGNHYVLNGKVRPGKDPELDVSLRSESIALNSLAAVLKVNRNYLPEQGRAGLVLTAALRNGIVSSKGDVDFSAAGVPVAGKGNSFRGGLSLLAVYDLKKDFLSVDKVSLRLDKLLSVRASGSVRELKRGRFFAVDLETDEIDISGLAPLIPELERKKIVLGGRIEKGALHLRGSADGGFASAGGKLGLLHGTLMQGQRPVFNDLNISAGLSATRDVLSVSGKAVQPQSKASNTVLETLDATYRVTFDRRLRRLRAQVPSMYAKAMGGSFNGAIAYSDGVVAAENAEVKYRDITVSIGKASAAVSQKKVSQTTTRLPLNADFSRCNLQRGDARLLNLYGNIRGAYLFNPKLKWLEGAADVRFDKALWRGKETGASTVSAVFSETGCKASVRTVLHGGSVLGEIKFNPFDLHQKADFKGSVKALPLAGIIKYAGVRSDLALSAGLLDAAGYGSYSRSGGLAGHFEVNGEGLAITGKGGKSLLADGGVKINSDLSGKKLVINQALLTAGKGVALKVSGVLDNVHAADRQGRLLISLPGTPLEALSDKFLNILPRSIQEATVTGSLASEVSVGLQDGRVLVEGSANLTEIGIDAPTEKVNISGVNGVIPLSFELGGKSSTVRLPESSNFNRQNYDSLLHKLRGSAEKGDVITATNCSFGGISLGQIRLKLRASKGVTGITSLDSSLFGGAMLGKGFITAQNGILYRGDLLFNDLSLVQLCKAFPAIAGYISGRIDGVLSFQGKGKQLSGVSGFTEFWARETAGEKMLVSREFLQRLSGKKLSGFFFSSDRSYDRAGIKAVLENGFLTFDSLDISHTNLFGVRDLGVTIAPSQNRIAFEHLLTSIREAAKRGKSAAGAVAKDSPAAPPPEAEFKWDE